MKDEPITIPGQVLTIDGRPLKVSLYRSHHRSRILSIGLVFPAVLFVALLFVVPIGFFLTHSINDTVVNKFLPRTFGVFDQWNQKELPGEALYEAMFLDITSADKILLGRSTRRMNYEVSGWRSLILKTVRDSKTVENGPYKEAMIKIHKRWGHIEYWRSLGAMIDNYTLGYYLNSIDLRYDSNKNIIEQPVYRQAYNLLWWRTLKVSLITTFFCVLLGYPLAYLLATSAPTLRSLLLVCVLVPFWTSMLVRISAWMIMLEKQGLVNDALVSIGLLSDENRLAMMYNFTGTIIVMTQVLLPFMILPIYGVMMGIPPSYMKAAQSLGAPPLAAFMRVYLPLSLPGVWGGIILVFVLAIGSYITPSLVGGRQGQMIGSMVEFHSKMTLNWGLASAIGVVLLSAILVLFWLYDRLVGSIAIKIQ